jgi:hypothetical protein
LGFLGWTFEIGFGVFWVGGLGVLGL